MSIQKTEFQITGHLYKRSNDNSWANRLVSLSTDTGTIKIYAEKSGKKTMRGNCNIKKGKFTPLSVEECGKANAFELTSDDKGDDSVMVFAAPDQEQYNDWKSNIEICFTIGETRRRKSVLMTALPPDLEITESHISTQSVSAADETKCENPQSETPNTENLGIAELVSPLHPEQPCMPGIAENPQPRIMENSKPMSISITIPTDNDNEMQPDEKPKSKTGTPLGRSRLSTLSNKEDGAVSPSSRRSTPNYDMLTEDQRQKLDKLTNRKSFKVPQSMKNLLNSNGLDKEREEMLKQVKLELQSPNESPMTVPQVPPAKVEPKPPREIKLTHRPTEPQRSGHICRFDEKNKEHGEDAWITQSASLDVTTGQFELFSEVAGRKISRLKLNAADFDAVPYDCVFYGKLFAFQLRKVGDDPSNDPITILAADDMEGYGYWMISIEDAKGKNNLVSGSKEPPEDTDHKQEKSKCLVDNIQVPTTDNISTPLSTKQKLELQMKAKMEGRPIPTFNDEVEPIQAVAPEPSKLSVKAMLEMQMKAKLEGLPMPSLSSEDQPISGPAIEVPKKLTAKQKLELQMKAKLEGKPIPSFDDDEIIPPTVVTISTSALAPASLTAKQKLELQMKAKMEGRPIPTFDDELEPPKAPELVPSAPLTTKQKLELQMKAKMEGRPIPTFSDEVEPIHAVAPEPSKLSAKAMLEMQMKAKLEGLPMPSLSFDDQPTGHPSLPPLPKHDHQMGQQNAKALLEMQMKAKFEGKPIPHLSFEDDPFNPALEEKSGLAIPVPVRGSSIQSFSAISSPLTPLTTNLPSPKSNHFRSHEDPSQIANNSNFILRRSPQSAAGDLEMSQTMSRTQSIGSISAVVTVNDENMDDVLRYGRGPGTSEVSRPPHIRIADGYFPEPRMQLDEVMLDDLAVFLRKVNYPSDRLSRRIKIWYCSSGFALSTVQAVEQFVQELKLTGDSVLQQFAEEKFDKINDWANLLEVLRKYEQKMLFDMPNRPTIVDSIYFEVEVKLRDKSFIYKIDEEFNIENLIRQVAYQFKISEFAVAKRLPIAIVRSDFNPWSHGMTSIKEDLAFAEDLVLYQEEVIEQMWQSHSALKSVIEQKDEVINQLYNQLSEMQEKIREMESDSNYGVKSFASSSMFSGSGSATPKHSSKALQAIADREFNAADQDGDGRISREEWRKWIQDKHNLIQEHNQVKQALMNEIKTLRAAMPAQQDQLVTDLMKNEELMKKQEEELIQIHIERDMLKDELGNVERKYREAENEKTMFEEVKNERIKELEAEIENLKQQLSAQSATINPPQQNQLMPSTHAFHQPPHAQQIIRSNQTPVLQQSNRSRTNSHPYAYDMPEDGSIDIGGAPELGIPLLPSGPSRSHQGEHGDGIDHNMDLLTLASMDDSKLAPPYYSDNHLQPSIYDSEMMYPQSGGSQQMTQNSHPVQRLGSADGPTGMESYGFQGFPPPSRQILSQTRPSQSSGPSGMMTNALTVAGPRTMNIGSTPQRGVSNASHPNQDLLKTTGNRNESPRAPPAPAPVQIQWDTNHLARQRIRDELRNKGHPTAHLHAPNAFNTVKPKLSTQPLRKTTALENFSLPTSTNKRSESPRENQAVNINMNPTMSTPGRGNRFASPNRVSNVRKSKDNPLPMSDTRGVRR